MPFTNRVRLPLQLHSPQFPEERDVFRKANGATQTISVVVRKQYEMEVDWIPENWHQALKIALAHDEIILEGERYLGGISQDGDYNIEWQDSPLRYPTAKAAVKVQVTPFDATNSNCQTCAEATQLSLQDDIATGLYGGLEEDTDYTVDTADNDSICCYPSVFSLVSYNSDYLTSASIDPATGIFSFHTGTDLVSVNGLIIGTYRVTCPDGSYDEADITADINGSIEGCLAPSVLAVFNEQTGEASFSWDESVPGSNYYWEVYAGSLPVGTPVATGSVTDDEVTVTGLDADTDYYFQVRTVCETGNSNFIGVVFSTIAETQTCGSYQLTNTDTEPFTIVQYMQCNGNMSTPTPIFYQNSIFICALENSPGDPVVIATNPGVTITYLGIC